MAMADAFLNTSLGDGYEDWDGFYEYHKIGFDECEEFDYDAYKANGFQVVSPREAVLGPEPERLAF
jgi:ribose 5-phosphate isomerase B